MSYNVNVLKSDNSFDFLTKGEIYTKSKQRRKLCYINGQINRIISLSRLLRVKNSYDGFEQNITSGILSEACDHDLRTHISLLHDLL